MGPANARLQDREHDDTSTRMMRDLRAAWSRSLGVAHVEGARVEPADECPAGGRRSSEARPHPLNGGERSLRSPGSAVELRRRSARSRLSNSARGGRGFNPLVMPLEGAHDGISASSSDRDDRTAERGACGGNTRRQRISWPTNRLGLLDKAPRFCERPILHKTEDRSRVLSERHNTRLIATVTGPSC